MTEREFRTPFSDPMISETQQARYGLENAFDCILPREYNNITCITEKLYFLKKDTGIGLALLEDCDDDPFLSVALSIPCIYDEITYINQNLVLLCKADEFFALLLSSHYIIGPFDSYKVWKENFFQVIVKNQVLLYHLNRDILLFKARHTEYAISQQGAGFRIAGCTVSGTTQQFYFERNCLIQIQSD